MKQTLYLIRHGHTSGSETETMYGATELPLTKDGLREVAASAEAGVYPDLKGALVYSSGMIRTLQTLAVINGADPDSVYVSLKEVYPPKEGAVDSIAESIAKLCPPHHMTEPLLREINVGPFEMMTMDEILEDEYGRKWLTGEIEEPDFAGGDSYQGFQERVGRGLRNVLKRSEDEGIDDIVVVAHGVVITYIMLNAFPGVYDHNKWLWCPEPAAGFRIDVEDGRLVSWEPIGLRK